MTYFKNMHTPVLSMALLMPFHDASMLYFCFAVRGSLESTCAGGATSSSLLFWSAWPLPANLPNSHPISRTFTHSPTDTPPLAQRNYWRRFYCTVALILFTPLAIACWSEQTVTPPLLVVRYCCLITSEVGWDISLRPGTTKTLCCKTNLLVS